MKKSKILFPLVATFGLSPIFCITCCSNNPVKPEQPISITLTKYDDCFKSAKVSHNNGFSYTTTVNYNANDFEGTIIRIGYFDGVGYPYGIDELELKIDENVTTLKKINGGYAYEYDSFDNKSNHTIQINWKLKLDVQNYYFVINNIKE